MLAAACQGEDRGDVLLLQTAVLGEELVAVAIEGQVAGRDHDGGVKGEALGDRGHEHGRGRGHAEVRDLQALGGHCLHALRLY